MVNQTVIARVFALNWVSARPNRNLVQKLRNEYRAEIKTAAEIDAIV